jgi:rfaE bifunctional protein kinase chain/domain
MRFLVLGDIMLDRYTIGEVKRISPEAPVPVVNVKYQYDVLGGAANCARNIASITDKDTVDIIGYFDPMDDAGKSVQKLLKEEGIYFYLMSDNNKRPTTVKERIYSGNHPLLRIDTEVKTPIKFSIPFNWKAKNNNWLDIYDYIIISDYAKGVVTRELMEYIAPYADKIIIDPKPENWALYPAEPLLMTPNKHEHMAMRYKQPLPLFTLVTEGEDGMTLHTNQWSKVIPTETVQGEVIGAGDTVTSTMAVCLQMGYSMTDSAKIANECAGYVVSKSGTATITREVFDNILSKFNGENLE